MKNKSLDILGKQGSQKMFEKSGQSSFSKYKEVVIGKDGFLYFLKYEVIMGLFSFFPGALGIWFRRKFYPFLLGECGKKVTIGRNVTIRHPSRIKIGDNAVIDESCTLDAKGIEGNGIIIESGVFIGKNTIIATANGTLEIKEYANIGSFCRIGSVKHTIIGKKALIAAYCYVVAGGHSYERNDIPVLEQPSNAQGGVKVGDGVWLGTRVTLANNVSIGKDSIIGAHSYVNKDIPEYAVAFGVPATIYKMRK